MTIIDFGDSADRSLPMPFSGRSMRRMRRAADASAFPRESTGSLLLKSCVELHLEPGVVLRFTDDFSAYPIIRTRWEGDEQDSCRPLIYAKDAQDVALTGFGTLIGSGKKWWTAGAVKG